MSKEFKLWLEFEEVDPGNWDIHNDFCNIHVTVFDGRQYGINVWTYQYFYTSIHEDRSDGKNLNGLYQVPPDLFVQELKRDYIERTISDLLKLGNLDEVLNSSVFDLGRTNKMNCLQHLLFTTAADVAILEQQPDLTINL